MQNLSAQGATKSDKNERRTATGVGPHQQARAILIPFVVSLRAYAYGRHDALRGIFRGATYSTMPHGAYLAAYTPALDKKSPWVLPNVGSVFTCSTELMLFDIELKW